MENKDFIKVEEDGIVVYDESDDYDPGEDEEPHGEGGFRLPKNEDIFTDEYMRDFSHKMDTKIAREKRTQNIISVCVIVGVIAYILFMIWLIA